MDRGNADRTDPDDDKLLETALLGETDALVSGDQDLLEMSGFTEVPILSPAAFLEAGAGQPGRAANEGIGSPVGREVQGHGCPSRENGRCDPRSGCAGQQSAGTEFRHAPSGVGSAGGACIAVCGRSDPAAVRSGRCRPARRLRKRGRPGTARHSAFRPLPADDAGLKAGGPCRPVPSCESGSAAITARRRPDRGGGSPPPAPPGSWRRRLPGVRRALPPGPLSPPPPSRG